MDKPPLSPAQQQRLDSFTARIAKRDPAAEMALFLREVRGLMLLAGVGQKALAGRIAEIVRRPPEGEALPGHTLAGAFDPRRMSGELDLTDGRWPRAVVIDAVAQLYVERIGRPSVDEVYAHLHRLRRAAVAAQGRRQRQRTDQAVAEGRREPGEQGRRRLSKERDQAREEAAALKRRVEELETAATRSEAELAARSALLVQLTVLIYRLQEQLAAVRAELDELTTTLARRDAQLSASERRNAEQWRALVGGQAQIDQLDAEVTELRQRLARTWRQRVRQLLTPESATAAQTSASQRPELGEREQHRLDGVVEELLDIELGSGSGSVATAVRPVVLSAAVRTRAKTAVVVLLGAGLLLAAWLAPVFPGPAPTQTAFEQCVAADDVTATDHGKYRRTLLQIMGLIGLQEQIDVYDITYLTTLRGQVAFAATPSQANAILLSWKAADAYNGLSDYWDEKIVGNNVVVSVMIKPLRTGPEVDDVVTSCAAR